MSHAPQDHYAVLGVATTATQDQIKTAYRRLARQYHPDVLSALHPERASDGAEKFKSITWAHDVLSDPTKRHSYDVSRITFPRQAPPNYRTPPTYSSRPTYQAPPEPDWEDSLPQEVYSKGQQAWLIISAIPFLVSSLIDWIYRKIGLVAWIGGIVYVIWQVVEGNITEMTFWRLILTTENHPDTASAAPLLGIFLGMVGGLVFTGITWFIQILSRPVSVIRNPLYQRNLKILTRTLRKVSTVAGAVIGFLIARSLF